MPNLVSSPAVEEPPKSPEPKPAETPPAPPKEPPTKTAPAPTPEQLAEMQQAALERFYPRRNARAKLAEPEPAKPAEPEKPKEPPPEAPKETPKEPPKEAAKAPEPAKPEPAAPPAPAPAVPATALSVPPPVSLDMPGTAAQSPAPKSPEPELAPAMRATLEVLERMEKNNPALKGLATRTQSFWKEETDYRSKWQKEHPGEKFDDTAEEHDQFFAREPVYEDAEYNMAQAEIIEDRATERVSRRFAEEHKKTQAKAALKEAESDINQRVAMGVIEMVSYSTPEVRDLMKQPDGQLVLNQEIDKKIEESDPVLHEMLAEEAGQLEAKVAEVEKFFRFPGQYQIDPAKSVKLRNGPRFYPGAEVMEFFGEFEEQLLKLPPEQMLREGRRLISHGTNNARHEAIYKQAHLSKEQKDALWLQHQSMYWTLGQEEYRRGLAWEHAQKARERAGKLAAKFKINKNGTATPPTASTANPGAGEPPTPPEPEQSKEKSPGTATSSEALHTQPGRVEKEQSFQELVAERFHGIRR